MAVSVLLEFARAEQAGDPFAFRFQAQEYLLRNEGGAFVSSVFPWQPSLLDSLEALRDPNRDPALVQRIGQLLHDFLRPLGFAQHEQRIITAVRESRRVVVTIRSAAAELYALPWELLTLRMSGQHIGELPNVLLRYEWPDVKAVPSACPPMDSGRILFAWSASGGSVPAADHLSAIQSACRQGGIPFDPESDVVAHASGRRISAALDTAQKSGAAFRVLHLLCHGGAVQSTFGLSLDSDDASSTSVVVDAGRLRQLLAPFAGTLRLVVLSACDSGNPGALGNHLGSVAQTLHRAGFASVIGSRYPLSVQGARNFVDAFYERLLAIPSSLEEALLTGRRRLTEDATSLDWASLQLYARSEDGEDTRPVTFRPYRGLLAFQPEHHRFLFGRDPELAEIVSDLEGLRRAGRPRLLIIAGVSGTGKSSLALGGAVPRLLSEHRGALRVVRLRPGTKPLESLSNALVCESSDHRPVLVVVDQFEELFTHVHDRELRSNFARTLWSVASDPSAQTTILITLRVDFIGRCGELELDDKGLCLDRVAYDEAHRIFLSKPGPEQLRAAITEPAHLCGLELEAGLANRIVHDLGTEPGALPLLQDTLDLLWQKREGRLFTQKAYDELDGVVGALCGHADALYDSLSESDQVLTRRLMVRLVDLRHAQDVAMAPRRRCLLSKLRPADENLVRSQEEVVAKMVDARLLVRDQDGSEPTIEIAHEALIRSWMRLHKWMAEDQLRIAALAEFESWVTQWQQYGTLLVGNELVHAEAVAQHCAEDLGKDAQVLLRTSQGRRTRATLGASLFIVVGCISIILPLLLISGGTRTEVDGLLVLLLFFVIIPLLVFTVILFQSIRFFWIRWSARRKPKRSSRTDGKR